MLLPAWRKVNGRDEKHPQHPLNSRRCNPVHQQLELPLAGSHLTRVTRRDSLIEIRKL